MNRHGGFQQAAKGKVVAEMNVVPFIDVVLVLLVVFMVATPLMTQGVHVELPRLGAQPIEPPEHPPLVVSIDAAGQYYLNRGTDEKVSLDLATLGQQVQQALATQPGSPVLVRGDRDVSYGRVMALMGALQDAGVPNVGLIAQAPGGAP